MFKLNVIALGLAAVCLSAPAYALDRSAMDQLLAAARTPDSPAFHEMLTKAMLAEELKSGVAFNSNGPDFVFAVQTAKQPTLVIDEQPAVAMKRAGDLWFYTGKLAIGTAHRFHYLVDGAKFG